MNDYCFYCDHDEDSNENDSNYTICDDCYEEVIAMHIHK